MNSYTATHYGECQLCGHTQKLPGGGLLSLHGYSVKWNCFMGTCPGSRGLPYEQSTDLLAGQISREEGEIERLKMNIETYTSKSNKRVWVQEWVGAQGRNDSSGYMWRLLESNEYTIEKGEFTCVIKWTTLARGKQKPEAKNIGSFKLQSDAGIIREANARRVSGYKADIAQRKQYIKWLQERITNWVQRDLRPVLAEDNAPTLHALNTYWLERDGSRVAICSSGYSRVFKQTTDDRAKVTCKACLKALAARDADNVVSEQANALIAEMVAKYGEGVKKHFSDAAGQAVKELRYQRKDIDKAVRKLACDRIERGIK